MLPFFGFWSRLGVLLVTAAVLSGCAAQPPIQPVALREASSGTSLVYFFRPNSDAVDSRDNPTLAVDDRPTAVLGFASYTAVTLAPGKHPSTPAGNGSGIQTTATEGTSTIKKFLGELNPTEFAKQLGRKLLDDFVNNNGSNGPNPLYSWVAARLGDTYEKPDPTSANGIGASVAVTAGALFGGNRGAVAKQISTVVGGGAKLENLTAREIARIQNAANRTGTEISVVGSRANGTARATSDWDYVVSEGTRGSTVHSLRSSLPEGARGLGEPRNQDFFRGVVDTLRPYITFTPR